MAALVDLTNLGPALQEKKVGAAIGGNQVIEVV